MLRHPDRRRFIQLSTGSVIPLPCRNHSFLARSEGDRCGLVNSKDGSERPNLAHLGRKVPIGEGAVNFRLLLRKLKEVRCAGPVLIEREVSGLRFPEDVKREE